ncbi:hypothetical protein SLE2022_122680 [Rubroshorea leprosula]
MKMMVVKMETHVFDSDCDLEDDENLKSKFPEFTRDVDMENPQFRVGMLFAGREQLKEGSCKAILKEE